MTIRLGLVAGIVVALGLFAGGQAREQGRVGVAQKATPETPLVFRPFYQGVIPDDKLAAVRAALPYDRISLERSGGMVIPGGLFKLTLSRNGEATLWSDGGNSFGRIGNFVGTVGIFDLGKVNHLIEQVGFDRLAPRYAVSWTDMQTMTVRVSTADRTVSVADYGGAAPVEFWAIERTLEAIAYNIPWKPK
jgi:hypothetical protein